MHPPLRCSALELHKEQRRDRRSARSLRKLRRNRLEGNVHVRARRVASRKVNKIAAAAGDDCSRAGDDDGDDDDVGAAEAQRTKTQFDALKREHREQLFFSPFLFVRPVGSLIWQNARAAEWCSILQRRNIIEVLFIVSFWPVVNDRTITASCFSHRSKAQLMWCDVV